MPLGFILLRVVRGSGGYSSWEKVVDRHLLEQLLQPAKQGRDHRTVLALAWLLAVLALAGPSWEKVPPVKFQPDVPPLVVVLDLSRSMQARDLHPSRLAVAKSRLHTLLQQLPPRPVGLVVYASQAHTAMPLTRDKRLIIRVLGELTTGIMPSQGSNPSAGLTHAATLLNQTQAGRGDILLITDGVDSSAVNTTKQLTASGYQTSVLAVGSLAGSKIPDENGRGYLVSENRTVRVAVNQPALRALAESGNGGYARISNSGDEVATILRGLGKARHGSAEGQTGDGEVWREGGPLFLLLILPLALLAFRRGAIAILLLCIALPAPRVEALSWDSLWRNSDQRALKAMQERRAWEARELFTNPLWRGIAEYRTGDFHAALKSFSQLDSAQAHYNRGNTLMHL
ncbi:MAG: VWA domain-containing protein, partial [Gammaproteobacteria bacterium]|nr:VWA domain-containing protein [Gammaproteobacteria bacterium]